MTSDERALGQAEGKIEALERTSLEMRNDFADFRKSYDQDMRELRETIAVGKGAWKVASWIATVIGALAGFLVEHFLARRP